MPLLSLPQQFFLSLQELLKQVYLQPFPEVLLEVPDPIANEILTKRISTMITQGILYEISASLDINISKFFITENDS